MSQHHGKSSAQGAVPPRDSIDAGPRHSGSYGHSYVPVSHVNFTPHTLRIKNPAEAVLDRVFERYLPNCTKEILPYLREQLSLSVRKPCYIDPNLLQAYTRAPGSFALQERIHHNSPQLDRHGSTPPHTVHFRLRNLDDAREWQPTLTLLYDGDFYLEVAYPHDLPKRWEHFDDLCTILGRPNIASAFDKSISVAWRDSDQVEVSVGDSLSICAQSSQMQESKRNSAWCISEISILDPDSFTVWDALGILEPHSRGLLFKGGLIPAALRFIQQPTRTETDPHFWIPEVSQAARCTPGVTVTTNRKMLFRQSAVGMYPAALSNVSEQPLLRSNVVASPVSPTGALNMLVVQPGGLRSPEGSPLFRAPADGASASRPPMLVPADISSAAADWAVRIVCADRTEKSATAAAQTSMWEGLRTLTASLEPSFHLPTYTELLTALSHHTFFDYPRTVRFVVPTDVSKIRVAFTLRR